MSKAIKILVETYKSNNAKAIVDGANVYTYAQLYEKILEFSRTLESYGILEEHVVGVYGDYSFEVLACIIAVIKNGNTIIFVPESKNIYEEIYKNVDCFISASDGDLVLNRNYGSVLHGIYKQIRESDGQGLVLLTSGSTGRNKFVFHDMNVYLSRYVLDNKKSKYLSFLKLDHIAGIDNLFKILFSSSMQVMINDRSPRNVCREISEHAVEIVSLPASYINFIYISEAHERYNLGSVKILALGSEPITVGIVNRARECFPNAKIIQKYGMTEIGSPKTHTNRDDPQWFRFSSETETKIVNDVLWLKCEYVQVGDKNFSLSVLNTDGGWLCTNDVVEKNGEWIRIVGRTNQTINVGGEKFLPTEVETIIESVNGVINAVVYSESDAVFSNRLCALVQVSENITNRRILKSAIIDQCKMNLESFKIPRKISITCEKISSARLKKNRNIN